MNENTERLNENGLKKVEDDHGVHWEDESGYSYLTMWCPACAAESFEELWDAAFRVVLCDVMCWDCVRAGIFPTEDQIRAVLIRFDQEVQRAGYRMTWKDVAEHYQLSGLAVPSWAIE